MRKRETGTIEGDGRGARIAIVSLYFPPEYSGAGIQLAAIIDRLRPRGVHFRVLTAGGEASSLNLGEGLFVRRFRAEQASVWGELWFGLCSAFSLLRHPGWDVLHMIEFSIHSLFPYAIARLMRRPVLVKTTLLASERATSLAARVLGASRDFGYRNASAVVALSDAIESGLRQAGARGEILRIPNGVDTDRFRPPGEGELESERENLGISRAAFVPALCGMRIARKNAIDLVRAAAVMTHRPVEIVLIGPPGKGAEDPAYERELRAAIAALPSGVSARVFDGVPSDEVARILRAADVYVLPSQREGMPNSVLEAMAVGLPCIATDIPGSRDVLSEGGGSLVPLGDVPALARELDTLASNPERRTRLGGEALNLARRHYAMDRVAERYGQAYAKLINQDRGN